jgi:hypothetical protein
MNMIVLVPLFLCICPHFEVDKSIQVVLALIRWPIVISRRLGLLVDPSRLLVVLPVPGPCTYICIYYIAVQYRPTRTTLNLLMQVITAGKVQVERHNSNAKQFKCSLCRTARHSSNASKFESSRWLKNN